MDDGSGTTKELADPNAARTWCMFCHLSALAGYLMPLGNIIGPLVVWSIQKDKIAGVDEHGRNSLNFQISITIALLVSFVLCFFCIGIPLVFGLLIADIICVVIASVQASNGQMFKYPLTIRFLK